MSRIDDQRQSIFFQSDKNSGKIVEAQKRKQIAFMSCIYVYIFSLQKRAKKTQVYRYSYIWIHYTGTQVYLKYINNKNKSNS